MSRDEESSTEPRSLTDWSEVTVETKVRIGREMLQRRQADYEEACRLISSMNSQDGLTFVEIGDRLGISHSTAHHMATQYRKKQTQ